MCAAQRGHKVDFEHESSGPSHAPTWTANVLGEWLPSIRVTDLETDPI